MEGRIFVTGGTGSLGTALLRRAAQRDWDCRFTVYSRDEVKQGETKSLYPTHAYRLGDVRDLEALTLAMRGHDVVIHAAAYKQVPAAEVNADEAVATNVFGSRNVVRAALMNNIPLVLGISTDKACAPINCYGQSKALMERLFQQGNQLSEVSTFLLVRYGNVLGSRGSVLPLFLKQAQNGLPVTVTNPNMTRFWLTLDDALDLIELALTYKVRGGILIPPARASSMDLLATVVAQRYDAKVEVTGTRPGEKLHEQLVHSNEAIHGLELANGHFLILPAWEVSKTFNHRTGGVPLRLGFEYTSDKAPQFTYEQLAEVIWGSAAPAGEVRTSTPTSGGSGGLAHRPARVTSREVTK